jgi:hypothetical protein
MGDAEPTYHDCAWGKYDFIGLVSVDNSTKNTRPGDSFVDDTTTGVTSEDTSREPVMLKVMDVTVDEVELIDQTQVVIKFFFDLLQVTGGDLAPEKCVWYLIAHRWKKDIPRLPGKNDESSRDKYHIQRNRSNISNSEKSREPGTPHFRVSSDR